MRTNRNVRGGSGLGSVGVCRGPGNVGFAERGPSGGYNCGMEQPRETEPDGQAGLAALAAWRAFDGGDPAPLCEIVERGSLAAFDLGGAVGDSLGAALAMASRRGGLGTIARYYGGVYFGYEQALALDSLLATARSLADERARDTVLAATLGAASDCVSSVGSHFAQPLRPRDRHGQPKLGALRGLVRRRQ